MGDPTLGVPDTRALRRRVLLAGVVTVGMFFAVTFALAWLDGFSGSFNFWVVPLMLVVYFAITRPLLKPVREAIQLRRRLAYSAYLAERERKGARE